MHAAFSPGEAVRIRSTGAAATVVHQEGTNVLVRREPQGFQWTYDVTSLEPAAVPVCELPA